MKKNALMYCCRSDRNSGHLHRSIEVARQLSETHDVAVLIDDNMPVQIEVPKSVQLIHLPTPSNEAIIARRDAILSEFERLRPRVVIIDGFPFSQQQRRGELLPLIERARNGIYGESLVVCTTDGIVIDESAAALLDKILHHGQAKPGSRFDRFCRKERFDGVLPGFLVHSNAVIAHRQYDVATERQAIVPLRFINDLLRCGNNDCPAVGHRVTGVSDHVEHGAFKAIGIYQRVADITVQL
jgi:hypothetical protein